MNAVTGSRTGPIFVVVVGGGDTDRYASDDLICGERLSRTSGDSRYVSDDLVTILWRDAESDFW